MNSLDNTLTLPTTSTARATAPRRAIMNTARDGKMVPRGSNFEEARRFMASPPARF